MEELLQYPIGLLQRSGLCQSQVHHQAVLQGTKEALNPSLGLGREGEDGLDPQLLESAAKLGRLLLPLQLLLEVPGVPGRALEDAMPITVEGQGNALASYGSLQKKQIALGVLLLPEQGIGDGTGGIVDGSHQSQIRAPSFQPVVATAVDLKQHPLLRIPLSPASVEGRSPSTRTPYPSCDHDAPHRRTGHYYTFSLPEQLR